MDTHKKVEEIARRKLRDHAGEELKKLASENIESFINHCEASGFGKGIKVGFWIGIVFSLLIYFIVY